MTKKPVTLAMPGDSDTQCAVHCSVVIVVDTRGVEPDEATEYAEQLVTAHLLALREELKPKTLH